MAILNAMYKVACLSAISADLIDKILEVINAALNGDISAIVFLAICTIVLGAIFVFVVHPKITKPSESSNSTNDSTPGVQINIQSSQGELQGNCETIDRDGAVENLRVENKALSEALKERIDFIEFIEYLFSKDFTILPKICLAVDSTREYNQVNIKKITAIYEYDMSELDCIAKKRNTKKRNAKKCNTKKLTPKTEINYIGRVKFFTVVENCDLPAEYIRYAGNMYADKLVPVYQKHGNQEEYKPVPYKKKDDKTEIGANVGRYPWSLLPENIGHDDTVNIDYYWDYSETGKAEGSTTIIHYPKSYGRKIETFEIKVVFKSTKIKVKEMILYRVGRTGKAQKYSSTYVTDGKITGNEASLSFSPSNNGYEAYYVIVNWGLK